jgi:integrase
MALVKRGRWWWTDFSVNGVRFRQPIRDENGQHTKDWREALSREKELIAEAQAGRLIATRQSFARLAFSEAVERYLADRTPHLAARSIRTERERLKLTSAFFGTTPLTRISCDSVRDYIGQRKQQGAANRTINMEIGILRRILKRAKRWHLIADEIPHLPERCDVGRALSFDEKARLLRIAATKPEWETARLAAILALNTTMRGCELKGLRWQAVDFIERTITVRRTTTKTDAGERVIPLNQDAWSAILQMRKRGKLLLGTEPQSDWYVFPHAEGKGKGKPEPIKPMTGWRSAWRSMTRAIHCPVCDLLQQPADVCANEKCKADISKVKSPLSGLRFHDLRHHAITELSEGQASDQTIMSIAGHISPRMLRLYSHVRTEAKRQALDALSTRSTTTNRGGSDHSYGTKHDTKSTAETSLRPQAIENNGGRCRT